MLSLLVLMSKRNIKAKTNLFVMFPLPRLVRVCFLSPVVLILFNDVVRIKAIGCYPLIQALVDYDDTLRKALLNYFRVHPA